MKLVGSARLYNDLFLEYLFLFFLERSWQESIFTWHLPPYKPSCKLSLPHSVHPCLCCSTPWFLQHLRVGVGVLLNHMWKGIQWNTVQPKNGVQPKLDGFNPPKNALKHSLQERERDSQSQPNMSCRALTFCMVTILILHGIQLTSYPKLGFVHAFPQA